MGSKVKDFQVDWRTLTNGKREPSGGRVSFFAVRDTSGEWAMDEDNHRMWFRASTPGLKGDNLNIPVKAWKKYIKEYMAKNPVFVWGHDYWKAENAIGHAEDYRIIDDGNPKRDGLYLYDQFGYGYNPLATMTWHQFMNRDLNAVSVGWEAPKWHREDTDSEDETAGIITVDEAKLLEHSACILPMDEDALAMRMVEHEADCPDLTHAMRAYAAGTDPLAKALKRVLGDDHCSILLRGEGGAEDEPDGMAELLHIVRDVQQQVHVLKDTLDLTITAPPSGGRDDRYDFSIIKNVAKLSKMSSLGLKARLNAKE